MYICQDSGWNHENRVLHVLVKEREQAAALWHLKERTHMPENTQYSLSVALQ
jgi:hypothetical protein